MDGEVWGIVIMTYVIWWIMQPRGQKGGEKS